MRLFQKWKKKRLDNAIKTWKIDQETNLRELAREANGQACIFNIPDYKKKRP
jgi:hypothetical protein